MTGKVIHLLAVATFLVPHNHNSDDPASLPYSFLGINLDMEIFSKAGLTAKEHLPRVIRRSQNDHSSDETQQSTTGSNNVGRGFVAYQIGAIKWWCLDSDWVSESSKKSFYDLTSEDIDYGVVVVIGTAIRASCWSLVD